MVLTFCNFVNSLVLIIALEIFIPHLGVIYLGLNFHQLSLGVHKAISSVDFSIIFVEDML